MSLSAYEVNFDGLVGPTHTYGGLAWGNRPSFLNKGRTANPRAAALQGLQKMKMCLDLGIKQAFLPPHERPYLPLLNMIGFTGNLTHVLNQAKKKAPWIFPHLYSASSMWAANAATITPSIDSSRKKVQITCANLQTHLHRSLEAPFTEKILKKIFPNPIFFDHHPPLPSTPLFSDEGAANSLRLARNPASPGVHLFVYGESKAEESYPREWTKFRPRQTKEAQAALAELHQIYEKQLVFAEQTPQSIELGAFHNDLLSMSHLNLLILHEEAFLDQTNVIRDLKDKMEDYAQAELLVIPIKKEALTLDEAIQTFFFNGQILSTPDGAMTLLAPTECQHYPRAKKCIDELLADPANPLHEVHYIDLQQSMLNGGGPACLRLRAVVNEAEFQTMNELYLLNAEKYGKLVEWVKKYYRDRLAPADLLDTQFALECQEALDAFTRLLSLGPLYSFQR